MRTGYKVALLAAIVAVVLIGFLTVPEETGCDFIKPARMTFTKAAQRKTTSGATSSGGRAFITAGDDMISSGNCAHGYSVGDPPNRVWYVKLVPDCFTASIVMHRNNSLPTLLYPITISNTNDLKNEQLTKKKFSSLAGPREDPISGELKNHRGLDTREAVGTPVLASLSGTVTAMHFDPKGGGNIVTIESKLAGWEIAISYLHLSRYATGIKVGMQAKRGYVVAFSGNTGRSTGPHLHIQIQMKKIPPGCTAIDTSGMVDPFCFPWDFVYVP